MRRTWLVLSIIPAFFALNNWHWCKTKNTDFHWLSFLPASFQNAEKTHTSLSASPNEETIFTISSLKPTTLPICWFTWSNRKTTASLVSNFVPFQLSKSRNCGGDQILAKLSLHILKQGSLYDTKPNNAPLLANSLKMSTYLLFVFDLLDIDKPKELIYIGT